MPANTIADDFINAGWLLAQMDLAAGRRAYKHIKGRCVTVGIEAMSFKKPVYIGDEVSFFTKVIREGNTSIGLKVEAWANRMGTGKDEKVTEGVFTFVALDENRRPAPIKKSARAHYKAKPLPPPDKLFDAPAAGPGMVLSLEAVPGIHDTNYNKDVFGGWTLEHMDKACAAHARAFTGYQAATVGVDAMKFIKPVHVGDKMKFYTEVVRTGRTSVTLRVESWAQRAAGNFEKVTEGRFSYVAVDMGNDRKPVVIRAEPK